VAASDAAMNLGLATGVQLALDGFSDVSTGVAESYRVERSEIIRTVARRDGTFVESAVPRARLPAEVHPASPHDQFDASWLRARRAPPSAPENAPEFCIADMFSGCGGLSLGIAEACRALGLRPRYAFANDMDRATLEVYCANFAPKHAIVDEIERHVDGDVGTRATRVERSLIAAVGRVDIVVAGPPCQGHSDLNNHTRRADPKNELVLRVARFAELFRPRFVLVENVQGIRHDRTGSLARARSALRELGYVHQTEGLLQADFVGAAQARRRYFLIASCEGVHSLDDMPRPFEGNPRCVQWAISDLRREVADSVFDSAATHSLENQRRIDYLFDHDLHELPDAQRPPCHASGGHSYHGVYGRMWWDRPAPTITRGFGSTGQGRFVHPLERRTLTPHEAARLQYFPDFFDFGARGRRQYQQLIGNAVPSKLAYAIALHQLG
jgi:DNA (cytosine-5)-methyltransferase 1